MGTSYFDIASVSSDTSFQMQDLAYLLLRFLRNPPILPPSLAITKFPPTTTTNKVPTLVALLSFLLPITQGIILPANLTASNGNISNQASSAAGKVHFAPHSEQEDLHAGVLQMPVGTLLTVVEMNLQEGGHLDV